MSAKDTLADVSAVIVALSGIQLPAGPLTDDERKGLAVASGVLGFADLIVEGTGDDLASAVMGVLNLAPTVAQMAMGLAASMRRVKAKTEKTTVIIGNLGLGVQVKAKA